MADGGLQYAWYRPAAHGAVGIGAGHFPGLRRLIWAETPLLSRLFTLRATRSLGFVRSLLKTALAHYHRVPPRQSLHLCDNLGGCPLITSQRCVEMYPMVW